MTFYVFPGNETDAGTLKGVVQDIERRLGLKRVVFVGDRGMVTTDNIAWLRQRGHGYLVGLQRALEKGLKAAGVKLSAPAALQALRNVLVVDI